MLIMKMITMLSQIWNEFDLMKIANANIWKNISSLPPCEDKCRKRCMEHFDEIVRENIRSYYWKKTFSERRQWLNGHITILPIVRKEDAGIMKKKQKLEVFSRFHPG